MAVQTVHLLRANAQQIYLYNDGPTLYFYDKANRECIKTARPSLLERFYGSQEADLDSPLRELGEKGMLVILELYQDDEFQAELSFESPLDTTEAENRMWSAPQEAFLSLPSGKLCIESMNSSQLIDEDPTDPGMYISVAPGAYVLAIQVLNPTYEQNRAHWLPEYYLTLTPLPEGCKPPNQPFVSYPREILN